MTRFSIGTAVAVAALAATAGCREVADPPEIGLNSEPAAEAVLTVDSRYQGPANIYLQRTEGAPAQRLGTVTFGGEQSFTLAPELLASATGLRLAARPVGSHQSVVTEPLFLEPGDTVRWTLLDPIEQSIASVRVEMRRR